MCEEGSRDSQSYERSVINRELASRPTYVGSGPLGGSSNHYGHDRTTTL